MRVLTIILLTILTSCSPCKFPTEQVIEKHYRKKKFTVTRECDSLRHVKMMGMARKY